MGKYRLKEKNLNAVLVKTFYQNDKKQEHAEYFRQVARNKQVEDEPHEEVSWDTKKEVHQQYQNSEELLNKALSAFNFGQSFIKWVNTFYGNIQSCVKNRKVQARK